MSEVEQLLKQTAARGPKSEKAVARLVEIGMPAAPAVIAALRESSGNAAWNLRKVVQQIRHPDIVPLLLDLIHEPKTELALAAFEALGAAGDARAVQPLSDYLLDSSKQDTRRSLAAEALGESGDPRVVEVLIKAADEILSRPNVAPAFGEHSPPEGEIDEGKLQLFLSTAVALAKLGHHEFAGNVVRLLRYRVSDAYSDDEIIRIKAAAALQHVIGRGMFHALQEALHDDEVEVRLNAIDALFYLGVREVIAELMPYARDKDAAVAERALTRLRDLTGEKFDDDVQASELQEWWGQHKIEYRPGACYRLGKPIWVPEVIALLAKPRVRDRIIPELKIITGQSFGYSPYAQEKKKNDLLKRAQDWWEAEGRGYEAGGLYKYGRKQEIESVL